MTEVLYSLIVNYNLERGTSHNSSKTLPNLALLPHSRIKICTLNTYYSTVPFPPVSFLAERRGAELYAKGAKSTSTLWYAKLDVLRSTRPFSTELRVPAAFDSLTSAPGYHYTVDD